MELKKRSEFPETELWDLSALYKDRQDFLRAIEKALHDVLEFQKITMVTYITLKITREHYMRLNRFTFK